ncbi:MAG: PTS transporter subunit EIIC [Bifidobacterium scardovii]|uniref:PTS transporter subunit EIIC n=1 Tax=Bifidobacterium scardovii TaxID=158787 RepID=UPI00290166EC|nr:PTS transporter subunit EIIC [Bifidobacterium scardovii]MDU2422002.1 PTS transporter subunit EIIC [Bifidobacterium scardovii]
MTSSQTTGRKSVIAVLVDGVSEIFIPIINLLTAAGILKGILAILTATSVVEAGSGTHMVLTAMGDSVFYFLPMLIAYTSAKKFGADPFCAVVISGILLYPSLNAVLEKGESVSFFGVPLTGAIYHSNVIPILMAVGLLSVVGKLCDKVFPDVLRGFLTPFVSIIVVGVVTLSVFGPLGTVISNGLASGYEYAYSLSPIVAGLLLGAAFQLLVIFGFHWGIMLISVNNIAAIGKDSVLALFGPSIFAQGGAALAVMIKSKNREFRSTCASSVISALFGITEPALFGVNLPRKLPMAAVCVAGGVGGAVAGLSGAQASAFAIPSLVTMPVFFGPGIVMYVASCVIGFVVAFVMTLLMKFDVDPHED